jgi:RNA-directed DNA polymerase
MVGQYPDCPFESYADGMVIHCRTLAEAQAVKAAVQERLRRCKLEAHPQKARIVYCQDTNRTNDHGHTQFDFLGYGFQPRVAKDRWGKLFTAFLPAISRKAMKAIVTEVRDWGLQGINALK